MTVATKPAKSTLSAGAMERLIDRAERDSLRRDFEMLRERSRVPQTPQTAKVVRKAPK